MKQKNFLALVQYLVLLLGLTSITWLSFDFVRQYHQIKQLMQANDLLAAEKYDLAISRYDQLLQTNLKQQHLLWVNRGYAFSGLNKYEQMLQSCAAATVIEPKFALAWNCQGEALYYLAQDQAALKAFEQAASINPQAITFWLNQGKVLAKLQKYNQAIAISEKAIKLGQKLPAENSTKRHNLALAFNQKGQSLLQLNQAEIALEAFEQALINSPNYLPPQQGKGVALYKLGRFNQAIKIFTAILQRDNLTQEQKAISWLYQGISLCQTQKFTAAERAFKQVLQLTTDTKIQTIAKAACGIR